MKDIVVTAGVPERPDTPPSNGKDQSKRSTYIDRHLFL